MRDNFYSALIDCSVLINVMWFGRNAKRFAVACVLLFVTMPSLSGISKNLEQKSILQTIEQLISADGFRDSAPVPKIHGFYFDTQKLEQRKQEYCITMSCLRRKISFLLLRLKNYIGARSARKVIPILEVKSKKGLILSFFK